MSPVLVVVGQVCRPRPFEMPPLPDDPAVRQVAAATSHPALRHTVLPRTAKGRACWLTSDVSRPKPHRRQTSRRGRMARIGAAVCRPRLLAIAVSPPPHGISRNFAGQDLTPVVPDDENAVQNPKGKRWDGEKAHRRDGLAMVSEVRQLADFRLERSVVGVFSGLTCKVILEQAKNRASVQHRSTASHRLHNGIRCSVCD
jgi:hypothetical protein